MGSCSYLDVDSMLASGGCQSAKNFLLLDELPSPLDGSRCAKAAMLPAPGLMLSLPEEDAPAVSCMGAGGAALQHAGHAHMVPTSMHRQHAPQQLMTTMEMGGMGCSPPCFTAAAYAAQQQQQQLQQQQQQQQCLAWQQMMQEQAQQRRLYHLVLLDGATGQPLRQATDDDAQQVARLLESESGSSALTTCSALPRALSFVDSGATAATHGEVGSGEGEEVANAGDGEGGCIAGERDQADAKRYRSEKYGVQELERQYYEDPQQQQQQQPVVKQQVVERTPKAPRPVAEKRTGPCTHCGVDESPQWRKGPPGAAAFGVCMV